MKYEDYKSQHDEIDKKIESLNIQINELENIQDELYNKFVEENKPFKEECFVEVSIKSKKGNTLRKIGYLKGWSFDIDDCKFYPKVRKVEAYDKNRDKSDISHYYIDRDWIVIYKDSYIGIKQIEPLPMRCCDTCSWLKYNPNLKCFSCKLFVDKKELEEEHPACHAYSFWSWSITENGINHRQQLIRDNGDMCAGEKEANDIFSQTLIES